MFEGFKTSRIKTSGAEIHCVSAGSGPGLLLLHGYPQTHVIWHKIAPELTKTFTVIAADLRGYGESSKPPDGENHAGYSKRAMAQDQVEVMQHFGFERFAVVGHDRGGRVGHRMALDHHDQVTRLAVLDIVPTRTLFRNVSKDFATAYYHWFFLIQPAPFPETLLSSNVEYFINRQFQRLVPHAVTPEALAGYMKAFRNPDTVHASCEDYRAAASIDLEHDDADIHRKIECPLLALWGERAPMHRLFDVLGKWKERAVNASGRYLPCGHYVPEESPAETLAALQSFLA